MSDRKKPLLIAHRGERILAPENTLKALHLALAQGADALEVDVRLCRDRKLVLLHDAFLWRRFRQRRFTAQTALSELRNMPFIDREYVYPDQVCTLDEMLEEFRGRVPINLDAKSMVPATRQYAHSLVRLIRRHNIFDQVWISSFNPFLVRQLKAAEPRIRTGFLFQDPLRFYQFIDVFLSSDAWHPHHKNVSRWFVRRARRMNKEVYVWTVNRPDVLARVQAHEVDGIITDAFFRQKPLDDGQRLKDKG